MKLENILNLLCGTYVKNYHILKLVFNISKFKYILPWFHLASYNQIKDWWQNLDKICPIWKMGKDEFSQTLLDIKNCSSTTNSSDQNLEKGKPILGSWYHLKC